MAIDQSTIDKIEGMLPHLSERQKRMYLASEAEALGHGAKKELARIFNIHPNTMTAGSRDLRKGEVLKDAQGRFRARKPGGGRKSILEKYPEAEAAVEAIVSPESFGNPENPLLWTTKSQRNISDALKKQNLNISHESVRKILEALGYSLHVNQKMKQVGEPSPDRDAQFRLINQRSRTFLATGDPVVSVDCKKKEKVGNFLNAGAEYAPSKSPVTVLDHDFELEELGKAVPYGVYDIGANEGWVSVGISKDTAEFAVNTLSMWWQQMGSQRYPNTTRLMITADGGGSNNKVSRLWKRELQKFANETGLELEVHHYPAGTSKWNKIEHRLFAQISKNWRGRPLDSLQTIVSLIASTTTKTGLHVECALDDRIYETGIKVSKEEMENLALGRFDWRGDLNYIIWPQE